MDSGLLCDTSYMYTIRTFSEQGNSDQSHRVFARTTNAFPCNFAYKVLDRLFSTVIRPVDPNEKLASPGVGETHTVSVGVPLDYHVYFENVSTATAPAQEIVITDQLDPALDPATLRFTEVQWGDYTIPISTDDFEFSVRQVINDYRAEEPRSWWVDVSGEVEPATGVITWTLRTLDPDTAQLPEDVFAGLLPPEDGTGRGQGHVSYQVSPRAEAPIGSVITNQASIVFDTNEPIVTNEVTNTIGYVADLSAQQIVLPVDIRVGDILTATVTVANQGPDPVDDASVAIDVPELFQVLSYATTHGTCSLEGSPICSLGRLENGDVVTLELILLAYSAGDGVFEASVSGSMADPEALNDTVSVVTTVAGDQPEYRVFLPLVVR